jgi:hypothetical protein
LHTDAPLELNETDMSTRGFIEEESKQVQVKPSPTKLDHTGVESDDLKAHLLQNDANSTNKYVLEGEMNLEKRNEAPLP